MKKIYLISMLSCSILLMSCGHSVLKSKQDAIKFLESHEFFDNEATIKGKSGGSLKSGFAITFENGKAKINDEILPYTITEMVSGRPGYNYFSGYNIQIFGSERYAYGGCINGYLSSGLKTNGKKEDSGCSLLIEGDYIKAYITQKTITKK